MRKIGIILLALTSAALLNGQSPPISFGGDTGDMPEIPVFNEGPEFPSAEPIDVGGPPGSDEMMMPEIPGNQDMPIETQPPQQEFPQQAPIARQQPTTGPVTVQPGVSKEIGGAPVWDAKVDFMNHFALEALFSSKPWDSFWFSPQMGLMRVTSLPQPVEAPRGSVMKWRRDFFGNPMVYLRARVNFPLLRKPDAVSAEQPLVNVPVVISQAVVFFQRPGGWMASASPLYVMIDQKGKKKIELVGINRGQGVWRAWVGHGGIYVENFIGAGLQAARTELYQHFRDEEIRLFAQGNSDIIFYLRPRLGKAVKASATVDLTNQ